MTPTPKLRFVEWSVLDKYGVPTDQTVRVLQQWWEEQEFFNIITGQFNGEWRDVPVEKEE
jgi:hypothetical protein